MTFKKIERQSLIVSCYSLRQWKQLRKFGIVHYVSQRLKYVVLYINKDQTDKILPAIERLNFVREVELSYRDDIDMTFKNAIANRVDPDAQERVVEDPERTDYQEFFKEIAESIDPKKSDSRKTSKE
ncbi:YlbG family protein [Facklamia hominis]|uniref:UPF0298 protein HMPREF9706_01700 n=1 Tax=Facklamia hominis CCUG 36813 TaxID=883111 RepID=K1LMY4_9LACT|nr:YlbG family protein [Facklamia hominis]EKB53442.1 hypothetical protein HMPREF9706_01700 [Facklamia hominis CCUG 36813]PKY92640.1 DUF2129 domain-containing protein [Facklamia hominis]WPJ90171.1 YlbG family protein [Facklamia hominis]